MARHKSRGRITAEEANELFQKPLALLHRPPSSLDLVPVSGSLKPTGGSKPSGTGVSPAVLRANAPKTQPPSSPVLGSADQPSAAPSSSLDVVVQKLRLAAERLWTQFPRESQRPRLSPEASTTSELAARLEEDLIEASCLAAELQRRHREAHAEHQRAIDEIRDMVNVLVEQVDRSRIVKAVEDGATGTHAVPEPRGSRAEHARSKRSLPLIQPLQEDAI